MLVFVSHSQEDKGLYTALGLALDAAHIARWDSATMSPSESLAEQLREAIRKCDVCVLLLTRRSVTSRWCLAEVGAFWGAGKKIFLFMGEPDLTDAELPPQFKGSLWTSDARLLVAELAKEPASAPLLAQRPANVFWLGHDLARSIRLAKFEAADREKIDTEIVQSLHHLAAIGLPAQTARQTLQRTRRTIRTVEDFSGSIQKSAVDALATAKNDIGNRIMALQLEFRGYPTLEEVHALNEELDKL